VQQGGCAKARLQSASSEFTFGEAMQLRIEGGKQRFRGWFVSPFGCDNK